MAKKPAASDESDETGSAAESGESGSQAETASDDGSQTGEAASESGSGSQEESGTEEAPKKKPVSARAKKATGKVAVPRTAPLRTGGSGHELVPVICSECYEELVFDSGVRSDVLTCPICEHQAARPDDAQLAIIAEKRKQEKTNFMIGLVLCLVSVGAFFVWIWVLRNPHNNSQENNAAFYGPMAVSLLTYIGCLAFTLSKYESARHDVYF